MLSIMSCNVSFKGVNKYLKNSLFWFLIWEKAIAVIHINKKILKVLKFYMCKGALRPKYLRTTLEHDWESIYYSSDYIALRLDLETIWRGFNVVLLKLRSKAEHGLWRDLKSEI